MFYGIKKLGKQKNNKKLLFLLISFFVFCSNTCTNNSKPPSPSQSDLEHNFQQGSADDIYNISDFLGPQPVLSSEEVFFAKTSPTDPQTQALVKYPPLSSRGGYPSEILNPANMSKLVQIKTASQGERAVISVAQQNIHIDPSISFINKYQFLDYTILNARTRTWNRAIAKLLGQEDRFKGFPDTIYYILPMFEGNYLVLYKVGPEDKIPYDELPLAKRVGELLAVPYIGYPIKNCVAKIIPDSNDRETGQHKPHCEAVSLIRAKYVKLNVKNKKIFDYKKKPDLFPKDFFTLTEEDNSNWFHVSTIVRSPDDRGVGHQLFKSAHLIEFSLKERHLVLKDASGDMNEIDKFHPLFIPIKWMDFQIKKDSEILNSSFSEEIKEDTEFENLRYFKIHFDQLVDSQFCIGTNCNIGKKALKSVFITDNYFSFDMELTFGNGAHLIKYAFYKKPINASYVPKKWFEGDSTKFFPTFARERAHYKDGRKNKPQEEEDQYLRVTRFDPQAKVIKWYFSKQTPKNEKDQWVREIGHLAIQLLNKAFEIAGRDSTLEQLALNPSVNPTPQKIKIVLDDTKDDKEVGDIRYNILNLMLTEKQKSTGGLLGLGPNVANPITGETISATANVWVTTTLEIYTEVVRRFIRFELYKASWTLQPFSTELTKILKTKLYSHAPESCQNLAFEPLGVSSFHHQKINNLCPEVTSFIEGQKSRGLTYDPENPPLDDKDLIESCGKKLAFIPLLGLTLHEILHGFGQRHIFSASVDTDNFYKDYQEIENLFGSLVSDKIKEIFKGEFDLEKSSYMEDVSCHPHPPQYSSVMDYMHLYNPILFIPGKLDLAALRFIYFDRLDGQSGQIVTVPSGAEDLDNPQKSIKQIKESQPEIKLKEYKVLCGGGNKPDKTDGETNPEEPLCKRFDYGGNPLEIAVNSILFFNNFNLTNGRNRYDSQQIENDIAIEKFDSLIKKSIVPLWKKWEQLRDNLLNSKGNKTTKHYSFLNPQDIEQYKQLIESEKQKSLEFKSYYDIREPIFNYLKRLAFMPSKHCIYKIGGEYHALSLERFRDKARADYLSYPEDSRERFINCQSPIVQNGAPGKLVTEVGFFGIQNESDERSIAVEESRQIKYFLRPKIRDTVDEICAFSVFEELMPLSPLSPESLWVNLMKEPDFGYDYYREFLHYMLEGRDLNSYINPYFVKDQDILQDLRDPEYLKPPLSYHESVLRSYYYILLFLSKQLQAYHQDEFNEYFKYDTRSLKDIGNSLNSSIGDFPFFEQIVEEQQNSQDFFIKNHPAVLHNHHSHSSLIIPYQDTTNNLPAVLFRRVNEFKACLKKEKEQGIVCPNSEDKRTYINSIEGYYYDKK